MAKNTTKVDIVHDKVLGWASYVNGKLYRIDRSSPADKGLYSEANYFYTKRGSVFAKWPDLFLTLSTGECIIENNDINIQK